MSRRRKHAKRQALSEPYPSALTRAQAKRSQCVANTLLEKECPAAQLSNTEPTLELPGAVSEPAEAERPTEDLLPLCDADDESKNQYSVELSTLDTIHFDVWRSVLLLMLSVRDIIRLCQVSRHFHGLLMNEETFKWLCVRRYDLSPNVHMNISYKTICRILYTAVSVAHWKRVTWDSLTTVYTTYVFPGHKRYNLQRLLYCLPVFSGIMQQQEQPDEPYVFHLPGFNADPNFVTGNDAKTMFLNLTEKHLVQGYTGPSGTARYFRIYTISSLKEMELARYGSVETYQAALLKNLFEKTPKLEKYLVYHHRYERLCRVADYIFKGGRQTLELYIFCGIVDRKMKRENLDNETTGSSEFNRRAMIEVAKICKYDSAVKAYIEERLLMSFEDYCSACAEFYKQVQEKLDVRMWWNHQRALFSGFGNYLASQYPDYKLWNKEELVEAMTEYGNTLEI
ncbi:uncharacterized protein LOC135806818 [Sycon ciliatum]|uniref:uncharacterized protein LOC135806818 n=1 Tax=Sycon ciliatum TaxID=27933 RepID=UPI0031F685DA